MGAPISPGLVGSAFSAAATFASRLLSRIFTSRGCPFNSKKTFRKAAGLVLGTDWLAIGAAGLVLGLVLGLGLAGDRRPSRGLRWSPRLAVPACVVTGIFAGVAAGLAFGAFFGLAGALVSALVLSLTVGLETVASDRRAPMSAQAVFSLDRRTALAAGLVRGVVVGVAVGVAAGVAVSISRGVVLGLLSAIAAGLAAMCYESAWPQWQLTRTWLAIRRRLPWRLMTFLAHAYDLGVLRQEGPFYQFRYLQMQDQLASRAPHSQPLIPDHLPPAGRRRSVATATSAIVVAALVAATVAVVHAVPHGLPAPRPHQPDATAILHEAAAWVAAQVSPSAIVFCDPVTCRALQADGIPASRLLVLRQVTTNPLGSDVIVATTAVRAQFGRRLSAVYAPAVIASFGAASARIDVRLTAPGGPPPSCRRSAPTWRPGKWPEHNCWATSGFWSRQRLGHSSWLGRSTHGC